MQNNQSVDQIIDAAENFAVQELMDFTSEAGTAVKDRKQTTDTRI